MQKRVQGRPCHLSLWESVILCVDFEVGLGMGAGGAKIRSFGSDDQMTTVAAFPDLDGTDPA